MKKFQRGGRDSPLHISDLMSYLIVFTTSKTVARLLNKMHYGIKEGKRWSRKSHAELFVHSLTGNNEKGGVVKVMENNGFSLSYIASLLNKYPNEIFVWVGERVRFNQFPEICRKAGIWLSEKKSGRKND